MPKFKPNTSTAMKRSGFKMAGYTYPGTSPIEQEKGEEKKEKEEVSREELTNVSLENRKKGFKGYLITYNDGSTKKILSK